MSVGNPFTGPRVAGRITLSAYDKVRLVGLWLTQLAIVLAFAGAVIALRENRVLPLGDAPTGTSGEKGWLVALLELSPR